MRATYHNELRILLYNSSRFRVHNIISLGAFITYNGTTCFFFEDLNRELPVS